MEPILANVPLSALELAAIQMLIINERHDMGVGNITHSEEFWETLQKKIVGVYVKLSQFETGKERKDISNA